MSETRAIITGTRNCEWRRASVGILLYRNHKNSRTGLRQAIHWNGTKIKSVRVDEKRRTDQTGTKYRCDLLIGHIFHDSIKIIELISAVEVMKTFDIEYFSKRQRD